MLIGIKSLVKRKRIKKMAIKLRPSVRIKNKQTGKMITEHYYLKCMSIDVIKEYLESSSAKPKIVQKCRNELIRREK
jgi:hypothetical protein